MDNNSIKEHTSHEGGELKRVLRLPHLIAYGIAYILPLTTFTTYGIATTQSHGLLALSYVLTTTAMAFTAFSYAKLVRKYPTAGSVYTYATEGFNGHIGFLSGWSILMDYMLLPMLTFIAMSIYLHEAMPFIPFWMWMIITTGVTFYVCYRGIEVSIGVSSIIVVLQLLFIIALVIFILKWLGQGMGAATCFSATAFFNAEEFQNIGIGGVFGTASVLALGFLGFDGITTLSEETINPTKTVGKGVILTCIIMGAYFVFISYLLTLAWPNAWFELKDPESGSVEIMTLVGGPILSYLFTAGYVLGCFASAVNVFTSAARIFYSMGRDQILPEKFFGHVHPKYGSPDYNLIVIAILSLAGLFISLEFSAHLVNFGALLGFTLVNASVIAVFWVKDKQRSVYGTLTYLIAPLIGGAFTFTIWLNLDHMAKMLGLGWLLIGAIYLAIKTKGFRELPPRLQA